MRIVPRTLVDVLGILYVVGFALLVLTLMYVGRAGTTVPDALHTVKMTSHGRTFYLTAAQYHFYLAVLIGVPVCGILAVTGNAIRKRRNSR